jgi:hypothetical protein
LSDERVADLDKPKPGFGNAVSNVTIVAVIHCRWRRPTEAYPAREEAVGRWLRQSAECEDRGVRHWAICCRWPDKAPSLAHPLPCRRPLARVHWMKQSGIRRRKSEIRVIELRRRNACGRRGTSALPACQAPAGPASSGQGRKPAEPGARTARAFTGWRLHGDEQVRTRVTIVAPARVSWRNPIGRHPCRMMHSTRLVRRNTSNGTRTSIQTSFRRSEDIFAQRALAK